MSTSNLDPFGPSFEGKSLLELEKWLDENDLSNMSYSDLVTRLQLDLPTLLSVGDLGNGAYQWTNPTTAGGTKPPGANVSNNNIMSAPSQGHLPATGTASIGVNSLGLTTSFDPNGWINGSNQFVVPAGVYKWEYTYQLNYVGAPSTNAFPGVQINGSNVNLSNGISTNGANSYQTISGVQLLTASTTPTTFQPAIDNSSTPNASAQLVDGIVICTRIN